MIFMDLLIVVPVLSGRSLAGFFTALLSWRRKDGGGEGLFVTSFLTLRAALKHVILPFLIRFNPMRISNEKMVVGKDSNLRSQ